MPLIIALVIGTGLPSYSYAKEAPKIESFTFTPSEIDLANPNILVSFDLVASHNSGLATKSALATISNGSNISIGVLLNRIDSPINYAQKIVTYKGAINLPRDTPPGIYSVSVSGLTNNTSAGYQYTSDTFISGKIRQVIGAESGLLIKRDGFLDLDYATYIGPTYDASQQYFFKNENFYQSGKIPYWNVAEVFDPNLFFEPQISELKLKTLTSTPEVCQSDGSQIKFIKVGACTYTVFTERTMTYKSKQFTQTVNVNPQRVKPKIEVPQLDSLDSKNLPKTIGLAQTYAPGYGWVLPENESPDVCVATGNFVKILSGGTCILSYQSPATLNYLASDKTYLKFEIRKDLQTISFTPPATVNLSAKNLALSATASGGGVITYQTTSIGICSITGSTLNLLMGGNCLITATQAGTSTLAPISATSTVMITGSLAPVNKTIACVMGKKSKKVSGANPKCPKGYKLKK